MGFKVVSSGHILRVLAQQISWDCFLFSTQLRFVSVRPAMQRSPSESFPRLSGFIVSCLWRVCSLIALAMTLPANAAPASGVNYGPPSGWVKPHFFNQQRSANIPDSGAGQRWLLVERQINALRNETFFHTARRILTTSGVQNGSTLTIDFNPSYESLTLHWVRIWRGGKHLERLDTNNVRIVQQERELDQSLLSGEKSAILVLDDVRVGDIIDYAYSLKGSNPVFDGHFSCVVPVQMAEPVDRLLTTVLWPKQKLLYAKTHGCSVQPVAVAGKKAIEYTWDLRHVSGFPMEDSTPDWCDPQPWVQLTDFKTWAEVNQWALALFRTTSPLSPALAQKITEWKQIPGREQQLLAVLKFVQDDVRYFGIEIGDSTERPADPSVVFSRRFGDCKDKSLLLVTILRSLGFEAWPVLVNADMGRAIGDWRPTASAFDHCISLVRYDGHTFWLDPTMNYQRGPLSAHYLPDYGAGLVVSPTTTGLTAIPQTTGLPETTTTKYFQLRGKNQPADLKVVTVAWGRDAESLRELFATTKRKDIEKNFTHFYSEVYPGIKTSAPIIFDDDQRQNRVRTTEFYVIDKMWTRSDNGRNYQCEFYPPSIAAFLKRPVDMVRKLPLAVDFPEHQILHVEVTLPQAWPSNSGGKTVSDPAFIFKEDYRSEHRRLTIDYEYRSRTDFVSAQRVSQYVRHLNQSAKSLDYTLIWR